MKSKFKKLNAEFMMEKSYSDIPVFLYSSHYLHLELQTHEHLYFQIKALRKIMT